MELNPYEVEIKSAFKCSKLAEWNESRVLAKPDEHALHAVHNICIFFFKLCIKQQPRRSLVIFRNVQKSNNILFDAFQPSNHSTILESFIVSIQENWMHHRVHISTKKRPVVLLFG